MNKLIVVLLLALTEPAIAQGGAPLKITSPSWALRAGDCFQMDGEFTLHRIVCPALVSFFEDNPLPWGMNAGVGVVRVHNGSEVAIDLSPADVPAIEEERQPDHPCNLRGSSNTDCLTGPYKVWTCDDKTRVLLAAEDGAKHCIKFSNPKP